MTDYRRLRVALLGAGAVGSQVAALLRQHSDELADRAGARIELVGIAVRDPDAPRDTELPRELLTTDPEPLLVGSDIVIALMGGIDSARGRYVLIGDADDSYDFLEVSSFVEKLREGNELVQGCRLPAGGGTILPGAMPILHRWLSPCCCATSPRVTACRG